MLPAFVLLCYAGLFVVLFADVAEADRLDGGGGLIGVLVFGILDFFGDMSTIERSRYKHTVART